MERKINMPKIDFNSFDLILCVALFGGFWTGIWLPFIILGIIRIL